MVFIQVASFGIEGEEAFQTPTIFASLKTLLVEVAARSRNVRGLSKGGCVGMVGTFNAPMTATIPKRVPWVFVLPSTLNLSSIAKFVRTSGDHDDYLGTIEATRPVVIVQHFGVPDSRWPCGYFALCFRT